MVLRRLNSRRTKSYIPAPSKITTKTAEIAVKTPPKTIAPFPRESPLDLATKPKIKPIGPRIIYLNLYSLCIIIDNGT